MPLASWSSVYCVLNCDASWLSKFGLSRLDTSIKLNVAWEHHIDKVTIQEKKNQCLQITIYNSLPMPDASVISPATLFLLCLGFYAFV